MDKKTSIMLSIILTILIIALSGCKDKDAGDDAGLFGMSADGDDINLNTGTEGAGNDIAAEQKEAPSCPGSCDDNDPCTVDSCSEETGFMCLNEVIADCCGNDVCEIGETYEDCSKDCPECEPTEIPCMESRFDYESGKCKLFEITPCCSNNRCEYGENIESCPDDCTTTLDMSRYPDILDNKVILAIGDKAKGNDVFAATTISNYLTIKGKIPETLIKSKIADLDSFDMIVIGRPCENSIWDDLMGIDSCENFLDADTGMIKLIEDNGRVMIFISGDTPENTQALAEVLADPGSYDLKGTDISAEITSSGITLG
ncbi:hypothetical protein JXB31_01575 [Candidatus Woesearchaeota archaeon]|nr:hypothetical protein [Candidatus Woesearchaeota archaeon]